VKQQFSISISQDLKANWEVAFTFLPFSLYGGIFKVTYERLSDTKIQVHALKRNINVGVKKNSNVEEEEVNVGASTMKGKGHHSTHSIGSGHDELDSPRGMNKMHMSQSSKRPGTQAYMD
jgi:hypothetical protein